MNISVQTKVISLPILVGLILTAALLWPAHALADGPICSGPLNLDIPDSLDRDVPGIPVTHTLTVTDPTLIADLNIAITTTHTYVGDLIFTVTHKVGAVIANTVIISRPLKGMSVLQHEVACSGDNIDVTLDDEALLDIQENCAEGVNEGDGTEAYNAGQSYQPFNPLSFFDGDNISGTWELTITDNYFLDDGTLAGWCLLPNQEGDLQIFKTAIPNHQVQGQPLTYTLSYKNFSAGQTATNVVITDIIPMTLANVTFSNSGATITPTAGITYSWQVADLAPGEGGVITVTGTLSSGLTGGTSFINTAIITATSTETNTANNQSDATVFIRRPDLQISKDDGGLTVTPGDLITYTLAYTNAQGTATGVVIIENLPDNTSFNSGSPGWQQVGATSQYTYSAGNLDPGVSGVITFVVSISSSLPSGVNTITNTAQIGDDGNNGLDEDLEDNTSTQVTPVATAPDLAITKTDGSITATAGSLITYTLTYTNKGSQDATGVVITETVPTNTSFNSGSPGWLQVGATSQYTYSVGSLSVGPSQTITFVVAVNNPLPGGVSAITNTVQIGDNGANGADQNLSDNQDEETTPTAITTSQKVYLPLILNN